ncbi:hypothetical protein GCM10027615_38080 [Plantactinospora veratri]
MAAHERQEHLVHDLDEYLVGYGGMPRVAYSARSSIIGVVATRWCAAAAGASPRAAARSSIASQARSMVSAPDRCRMRASSSGSSAAAASKPRRIAPCGDDHVSFARRNISSASPRRVPVSGFGIAASERWRYAAMPSAARCGHRR